MKKLLSLIITLFFLSYAAQATSLPIRRTKPTPLSTIDEDIKIKEEERVNIRLFVVLGLENYGKSLLPSVEHKKKLSYFRSVNIDDSLNNFHKKVSTLIWQDLFFLSYKGVEIYDQGMIKEFNSCNPNSLKSIHRLNNSKKRNLTLRDYGITKDAVDEDPDFPEGSVLLTAVVLGPFNWSLK